MFEDPVISVNAQGWWPVMLENGTVIPVVAIIAGSMLLFTLVCGFLGIAFVKALKGGGTTRELREFQRQEAQAFQNLQRGFVRMGERVDSLETLLMGRSTQPSYEPDREFE